MTTSVEPEAASAEAVTGRFALSRGWPLTVLLVGYPALWVLGLGTLGVFFLAVPMAVYLVRKRPVLTPPGFGLWLLFMVSVLLSTTMLKLNPPGTLPETITHRLTPYVFNLAGYIAATIILLYAGNLSEQNFPRSRLVKQLAWFFVVVVAGGLLGTFAPTLQFKSPVEYVLPTSIDTNIFVQSLVHPSAAQLQGVLGYTAPRPSAPFGYTNTWGYCLALLLGWFVVAWMHKQTPLRRLFGLIVLGLALIPAVYSLNRGLWVGLGVALVVMAVRMAARGRILILTGLVAAVAIAGTVVAFSPLSTIIEARLAHPASNNIRTFTTLQTIQVMQYSPVLGFGGSRAALGSANSIVVGKNSNCPRCGNPTLGSNGQFWSVLMANGLVGVLLYVGFFIRSLWAYRRDRTAVGDAAILGIFLPLWFMWVYNALTMPLVISFLSMAVLWRGQQQARADALLSAGSPLPETEGVLVGSS